MLLARKLFGVWWPWPPKCLLDGSKYCTVHNHSLALHLPAPLTPPYLLSLVILVCVNCPCNVLYCIMSLVCPCIAIASIKSNRQKKKKSKQTYACRYTSVSNWYLCFWLNQYKRGEWTLWCMLYRKGILKDFMAAALSSVSVSLNQQLFLETSLCSVH